MVNARALRSEFVGFMKTTVSIFDTITDKFKDLQNRTSKLEQTFEIVDVPQLQTNIHKILNMLDAGAFDSAVTAEAGARDRSSLKRRRCQHWKIRQKVEEMNNSG